MVVMVVTEDGLVVLDRSYCKMKVEVSDALLKKLQKTNPKKKIEKLVAEAIKVYIREEKWFQNLMNEAGINFKNGS